MTDRQSLTRSEDKSRHVTIRLNNCQCLKMVCNSYEEIISQLLGGNRKHGEGNSSLSVLNVRVCNGTVHVPFKRARLRGLYSSLLALLLRLVLARTDPLKFSVNLDGIKISGSGRKIKRFPAKLGGGQARREKKPRGEAKPHQEEVKGDIFQRRTKVPFMG